MEKFIDNYNNWKKNIINNSSDKNSNNINYSDLNFIKKITKVDNDINDNLNVTNDISLIDNIHLNENIHTNENIHKNDDITRNNHCNINKNLTISKSDVFKYYYADNIINLLIYNGWSLKDFKKKNNYSYSDNSNNSIIKNTDLSKRHFWCNNFYLFQHLKKSQYINNYFLIRNGIINRDDIQNYNKFLLKECNVINKNIIIFNNIAELINYTIKNNTKTFIIKPQIKNLLYISKEFIIKIPCFLFSNDHLNFELDIFKKGILVENYDYNLLNELQNLNDNNIFINYFDSNFENYSTYYSKILNIINDIFKKTIPLFVNVYKYNTKLLWNLTFDFVIDSNLNIYLIDIVHNPFNYNKLNYVFDYLANYIYPSIIKNNNIKNNFNIVDKLYYKFN